MVPSTPSAPAKLIVDSVAESEQAPPEVLPSLEDWLDPETFTDLTSTGSGRTDPLEFTYLWYQITVDPTEEVTVHPY